MELELREVELDLPPEYTNYRDEGCDVAFEYVGHSIGCLNCPFPRCIYEQPRGRQRWVKGRRNEEIMRQFVEEKRGVKELATIFGVSRRTVQRVLKKP